MPTQPYKTSDGKRVPGATTVIGASLGWNKGALMHWAWEQGMEGKHYREQSKKAADAGTLAHLWAEYDIKGLPAPPPDSDTPPEIVEKAQSAFDAYLNWKSMSRIEIFKAEWPLISEKHGYGGTLDGYGKIPTMGNCLIDFKTSNGTYADHLIQLAAYEKLLHEHGYDTPGGIHLLRFGKEEAGGHFAHHWYRTLQDDAWKSFTHLLGLYDLKKTLEKLAR